VLAVASEQAVDHILSDDDGLCREASRNGLRCQGSPFVLVLLKQQGLVPAVTPVLDRMRQAGFGIEDALYQQARQAAGE